MLPEEKGARLSPLVVDQRLKALPQTGQAGKLDLSEVSDGHTLSVSFQAHRAPQTLHTEVRRTMTLYGH